jgi:glutathione S-transferase
MRAKSVPFEVTYINLREKPDWFLKISPHGKVPVLLVDDVPLFESNAIAEFLDEAVAPRLHPEDMVARAQHRAWTDYVPTFSSLLGKVYYCASPDELSDAKVQASVALQRLEGALLVSQRDNSPLFSGKALSLVDAAYAPFFQRYQFVEDTLKTGLLEKFPRVQRWARALLSHDAVVGSVTEAFSDEFRTTLARRGAFVTEQFEAA